MSAEHTEIITRVKAALDIGNTDQQRMRPHLKWEAGRMVTHLKSDDLTTLELAALIAVLHSAHARVLGGPADSRPTLSIVSETPAEFRQSTA